MPSRRPVGAQGDAVTDATDSKARVAVVVPTRNRAERVLRLLDALGAQDFAAPFEVVVVDDASTDDTKARLQVRVASSSSTSPPTFALSLLTSSARTGPAGARNRGWRSTAAPLIAFIDDDCVPEPGWLAALVSALDDADIVNGRTRPPTDQLDRIGPFSSYIDSDASPILAYLSCNIAYRRSVLEQLQGFDEERFPFPNGEDTDLGLRAGNAGFRHHAEPAALVWHDVGSSDFRSHVQRIGRLDGMVALVAAHPEARQVLNVGWFLRSIDKAVLIAWAGLIALLLRPRRGPARLLALLGAVLYVWQFDRSHYRSRSAGEWLAAVPQGFVADSWALAVLARSSVRHRTLLL